MMHILHSLILAKIHMVTKQFIDRNKERFGLILAKIHMVTKQTAPLELIVLCLILAKIHMVTKQLRSFHGFQLGLILAKIHMVTKLAPVTPSRVALSYSSKNPYGNKTLFIPS